MILDFNGWHVNFDISGQESIISKHTGTVLSVLQVCTTVRGQPTNDRLLSSISESKVGDITSVGENGAVQKRWKIANSSLSYREGCPLFDHTLKIVEVEELNLSSLTLGDMTVQPIRIKLRLLQWL